LAGWFGDCILKVTPSKLNPQNSNLEKIVSGGQTGVDLAAIDAAISLGLDWGGFIPKGRRNEDGVIPESYDKFVEMETTQYTERTIANVVNSDGTLIIVGSKRLQGGTEFTYQQALIKKKPVFVFVFPLDSERQTAEHLGQWVIDHQIKILNVAGPRQSQDREAGAQVFTILKGLVDAVDR
jgi:hypothetical protein